MDQDMISKIKSGNGSKKHKTFQILFHHKNSLGDIYNFVNQVDHDLVKVCFKTTILVKLKDNCTLSIQYFHSKHYCSMCVQFLPGNTVSQPSFSSLSGGSLSAILKLT